MKKYLRLLSEHPEFFLMAMVLFYWVSTATLWNPIALVLLAVLGVQLKWGNRRLGMILPGILLLVCGYLLLALFSEFNEFASFNSDAQLLLFVGLAFIGTTSLFALLMIRKNIRLEIQATN